VYNTSANSGSSSTAPPPHRAFPVENGPDGRTLKKTLEATGIATSINVVAAFQTSLKKPSLQVERTTSAIERLKTRYEHCVRTPSRHLQSHCPRRGESQRAIDHRVEHEFKDCGKRPSCRHIEETNARHNVHEYVHQVREQMYNTYTAYPKSLVR
jgi:hypothetical protein